MSTVKGHAAARRELADARAADVLIAAGSLGLAAATGSAGGVGMAGLRLGGGSGPLIDPHAAADNLPAAEVVSVLALFLGYGFVGSEARGAYGGRTPLRIRIFVVAR